MSWDKIAAMLKTAFVGALGEIGLVLSSDQLERFEVFEERLYQCNEVMNLTRIPKAEAWIRHFLDSLLMHDLIPASATVLDIGTGPGFPAWPLACARPDLRVTALDSNGKMIGFLRENPLPNLEVVQGRAEELAERECFDFVTGRAVAPLSIQLEVSAPFCKVGGLVVPMRTTKEEPLPYPRLGLELESSVIRNLPLEVGSRLFPLYRKVTPTPRKYPRRWSDIKKNPIEAN